MKILLTVQESIIQKINIYKIYYFFYMNHHLMFQTHPQNQIHPTVHIDPRDLKISKCLVNHYSKNNTLL